MNRVQVEMLLQKLNDDIASLPASAVQLVGALISLQNDLPHWLSAHILYRLGQRADMSEVSPAAEALMRMAVFSNFAEMEFAQMEIQRQHVLLKALALDDKVLIATAFVHRLAERVEKAANYVPEASFQTPVYSAQTHAQNTAFLDTPDTR